MQHRMCRRDFLYRFKTKKMADKKIILAIDDDPMTLQVFTAMLTPVYGLRGSKSAAEAMALLENQKPDLILLDIEMPDISGFEFIRIIKKNPKYMKIPVVIVSGHSEEKFVVHAEKNGAICVVAKPIDRNDLFTKIRFAFDNPDRNSLVI